jgi:hypothetical protein
VSSEPAGAPVALDGQATGLVTPAVVEGVVLSRRHQVTVGGGALRAVEIPLEPEPGRMVRRVHAKLASSTGALVIDSDPPGAEVTFDGKVVGATPVRLDAVRLDDTHRVDLRLAGFDIDQFVVQPDSEARFLRKLQPARRRSGAPHHDPERP